MHTVFFSEYYIAFIWVWYHTSHTVYTNGSEGTAGTVVVVIPNLSA
jgi:hypothetical protein